MISNLATSSNLVDILSTMSSTGDIVYSDILTSILQDFVYTLAEIIGYFLESHTESMPYILCICKKKETKIFDSLCYALEKE